MTDDLHLSIASHIADFLDKNIIFTKMRSRSAQVDNQPKKILKIHLE